MNTPDRPTLEEPIQWVLRNIGPDWQNVRRLERALRAAGWSRREAIVAIVSARNVATGANTMTLAQIRIAYPKAAELIAEFARAGKTTLAVAETLSPQALEMIESGATARRDAIALLRARQAIAERASR